MALEGNVRVITPHPHNFKTTSPFLLTSDLGNVLLVMAFESELSLVWSRILQKELGVCIQKMMEALWFDKEAKI